MAKKNKNCLSSEMLERIKEHCKDDDELMDVLKKLKPCSKRKPSEYNLFIKDCMGQESGPVPERMKTCAAKYRNRKQ